MQHTCKEHSFKTVAIPVDGGESPRVRFLESIPFGDGSFQKGDPCPTVALFATSFSLQRQFHECCILYAKTGLNKKIGMRPKVISNLAPEVIHVTEFRYQLK